ncbi:uncharacterized protein DSM5745_09670 [Aspergillus mulundensis]|uniref:Uncharacterized protein n=1 Tax=Aspergillus mulundensis TaxID=1810919 RepID=A0A3D8QW60_9EURO|nr:Uncharacterized protein DSM5745_09670 [Aspergillus mulundensis]RDW65931.1 Uncharacterized protein DSM5745_09670 [Aspergillus mulundensis]
MGDAWEDDWESQADRLDSEPTPPPPEKKVSSKVSKAQRRAQQLEFNRQLWAEAESPQTFHFYEAASDVPLKQEFKPTVTVLSRNPVIATRQSSSAAGAAASLARLDLNADDSDDEKPPEPTPEERQAMALKNREEKQRKYEEVRERLFGSPSAPTSGASSPRSATPPRQEGRGKGRGRGNGRDNNNRDRRDQSAASGKPKQLYDPASPSSRPNSSYGRRDWQSGETSQGEQPQSPRQPIRNPRGPDSSGRGGFRAHRGAKTP